MSRILLVEDDQMISEVYKRKFEDAGFEVAIASNGKDVLSQAKKNKFDLVILDIVLPDINGIQILEELRGGNYDSGMKIIIFSNLNDKEMENEALEKGADGYISKTQFNPTQLVDQIKRMLGEFQEQDANESRRQNGNGDIANSGNGSQKKILLIEDEEVFVEMFGKKLENDGFAVTYARNGAWGVKEAMKNKFDLIITDMVMPAMSGEEIIEKLKMEEETKNIPIIVLSASADDESAQKVKEKGIEDFIVKTKIVPSDLSKRIKEILGE